MVEHQRKVMRPVKSGIVGSIFTDALNMTGVTNRKKPGEVELKALLAGNDILLHSEDISKAKVLILEAVAQGLISEEEINRRVKKVLKAKYWAGLHRYAPIDTYKIADKLTTQATTEVIEKLYGEAITVAANKNDLLPFGQLDLKKIASITQIGNIKPLQITQAQNIKADKALSKMKNAYSLLFIG